SSRRRHTRSKRDWSSDVCSSDLFISLRDFKDHINNNDFLEWEEVYRDSFYGTLNKEVERIWALGKNVIFDIDVAGGLRIKRKFPDRKSTRLNSSHVSISYAVFCL